MKKNVLAILLLVICSAKMYGQSPVKFGIDAGMNLSRSSLDVDGGDKSAKIGFQIGVVAEYEFYTNFFIQSGLSFTTKGLKYKEDYYLIDDPSGWCGTGIESKAKATFNLMYLQLPIYAAYKLDITPDAKLVFNVGPYFAYGIGGKLKIKGTQGESDGKENIFGDDAFKRFDFGFGGGIGAEFQEHYFVGFKYELGVVDISRYDGKYRNMNASLTVGYRF